MFGINRIANSVEKMKAVLELQPKEKVEALNKAMDMDILEHTKFQELKSLAVAQGKLTLEEGQYIYQMLGNVVTVFNNRPLEVKICLTQLFKELLAPRVK